MKTRIRLTLLLFMLLTGQVALAANPGPKDGFRELRWGSKPGVNMLNLDTKKINMDVFVKQGEIRTRVAGVDGAYTTYLYLDSKLCRVELFWPMLEEIETKTLALTLDKEWGAPDRKNDFDKLLHHEWDSYDKKSMSFFRALSVEKKGWMVNVFIENIKCTEQAAENSGL